MTVGRSRNRLELKETSPPDVGGQDVPRPVPQAPVEEENFFSLLPGSQDALPILLSKPVNPEIKVSTLKPALFYLSNGKIFYDKHLPDPEPAFLTRTIPHPTYSPEYFTALHSLVAAPGAGYPANTFNFRGARIPLIHTKLNIPKWRELLVDYPKTDLADKLEFGFPIGIADNPELSSSLKNHSSSYMYFSWMDKFIVKEIQECGLTGPVGSTPFQSLHISPMMTSIKKPNKRRCVFDASFGMSLNKSTPKEFYLEERTDYDFPTLDDFQEMIIKVGHGARLWKRDLSRFFLQLGIDPLDYPNTGFVWRTRIFFFVAYMFGLHHSGLAGQNTTSAVVWIHRKDGLAIYGEEYNVVNYSDDLAGVEEGEKADDSYEKMGLLLKTLGLEEALDKATPPSTCMEYLGVTFDTISFKKTIPPAKLAELLDLLMTWSTKNTCTKRGLQSLCGKLLWVGRCVQHSRVFISRLLAALKTLSGSPPYHKITLSNDMKLDIKWWLTYIRSFNGVNFIINPAIINFSYKGDACLDGGGGFHLQEYWSRPLPAWMRGHCQSVPIHQKEYWVLLMSMKLWGPSWSGSTVELFVDNMAVCLTCTNQKPSDPSMASFLREYLYLVVLYKFHPVVTYINTKENFVADFLSRSFSPDEALSFFDTHEMGKMALLEVPDNWFQFTAEW